MHLSWEIDCLKHIHERQHETTTRVNSFKAAGGETEMNWNWSLAGTGTLATWAWWSSSDADLAWHASTLRLLMTLWWDGSKIESRWFPFRSRSVPCLAMLMTWLLAAVCIAYSYLCCICTIICGDEASGIFVWEFKCVIKREKIVFWCIKGKNYSKMPGQDADLSAAASSDEERWNKNANVENGKVVNCESCFDAYIILGNKFGV